MSRAVFLRTLRSRALWLLALLIAAALPLAKLTDPAPLPEGAAYCLAADLPDSAALESRLEGLGFVPAGDESALRTGVARGDWGCGLIVRAVDAADFLQAENAANPELWRGAATAALFSVEAPYFTAAALEPTGIPAEDAHARYDELYAAGSPFSITLENVRGQPPENDLPRDKTLLAGAAACLLGAVFAAALPAWEDAQLLRRRGIIRRLRAAVLTGECALRFGVLAVATALGAVLAGQGSLALRLVPYLLLCTVAAALLLGLTRRPGVVSVAAALLCLLMPLLCPVYADVSLLLPGLAPVQKLFLPWWLFYGL